MNDFDNQGFSSPLRDDPLSPIKHPLEDSSFFHNNSPDPRDLDFVKFKNEQRQYLDKKLAIQNRIESLQREYNFIQKLNTDDVTYIIDRKKEQAAISIQRIVRRRMEDKKKRLEEQIRKAGGIVETDLSEEEIKEIEKRKRELKQLRERVAEKYVPMQFYEQISEETKKELNEQIIGKKRLCNKGEMEKKNIEEIDQRFGDEFSEYMSKYMYFEKGRLQAMENMKEIEVMSDYLLNKENCKIENIQIWSQIADNFKVDDIIRVRKDHMDKLERYRNRKDWEAWIEEDELDIEGERVLAEIKNYKDEYFFNMAAYN